MYCQTGLRLLFSPSTEIADPLLTVASPYTQDLESSLDFIHREVCNVFFACGFVVFLDLAGAHLLPRYMLEARQ